MISIYSLTDPRTGDVCYVGKSVNPKRRWEQARYSEHSIADRWVRGLFSLGLQPRIRILEQCEDKAAAIARERWWMDRFFWRGEPLLNVKWGEGDGAVISPLSPFGDATRVKMRSKIISPEYRVKMSEAAKRRWADPEKRARLTESLTRARHLRQKS